MCSINDQIREQEELLQEANSMQGYHRDKVREWENNSDYHLQEINKLIAITEEPKDNMINNLIL